MGGARWHLTRVIPRAIHKYKRRGKKTPARLGDLIDTGRRRNADDTDHVPRRGSLWTDGTDSTLLVSGAVASEGRQRLRTEVHLCLWSGQSHARGTGLEDQPEDEHRANERVSSTSQPGTSG